VPLLVRAARLLDPDQILVRQMAPGGGFAEEARRLRERREALERDSRRRQDARRDGPGSTVVQYGVCMVLERGDGR
jgi:hypothetical protein